MCGWSRIFTDEGRSRASGYPGKLHERARSLLSRHEGGAGDRELATAFAGSGGRGHIYIVEPLGAFEDDPNLTNKRFLGNPTRSYRTRDSLKIISIVKDWRGHTDEAIERMLESLRDLTRRRLNVIED